jgi:hypothetical protein
MIAEVGALLEEIAEADTETPWSNPTMPTVVVCDRLRQLGRQLQLLFRQEEDDERRFPRLLASRPDLYEDVQLLVREHRSLVNLCDYVCELCGTSLRPTSTWEDIEAQFRRFRRVLCIHHAWEDAFLEDGLGVGSSTASIRTPR